MIQRLCLLFLAGALLAGCVSEEERLSKQLWHYHAEVKTSIDQLSSHIEAKRVRNATLLLTYASTVKQQQPLMGEVIDALAADATVKGPMFTSLVARLNEAGERIPTSAKSTEAARTLTAEFNAIGAAASVNNYNMALTDPINVLSAMSDGKLAPVTNLAAQAAENTKPAENLIGNPQYGSWQTGSDGDTFWAWYGKYALLSRMFERPVTYGYWSEHRRYSYYHDTGREYYSSPTQKRQTAATEQRVQKQFTAQGKQFQSPYARRQTTTTSQKPKVVSTPSKFQSAYASNNRTNNTTSQTARQNTNTTSSRNPTYNSRSSTSTRSSSSGGK